MPQGSLTLHQRQYWAWLLRRKAASGSVESLASTLVDAQVDLNPHQLEAALFACQNPLSKGVILADEVGLGKTIEAGLVISQRWAERKRRILIVVPANLRKQWHQELMDKFGLEPLILESKNYNAAKKRGASNPFEADVPVICSYPFASKKAGDLKRVAWDLVVLDEAHRVRNVYKPSNIIGRALRDALENVPSKVLLTATPLQNSLLELYGLVSFIDDRVFGNLDSFRSQFGQIGKSQNFDALRARLSPLCKRSLRRDVQPYVPYTRRLALVEEFTPSDDEQQLSALVADYLRRPGLQALPNSQRKLISMVLWKLLASSPHAIAGAMETMANRLQKLIVPAAAQQDLVETLEQDFEALDDAADEWPDEQAHLDDREATANSQAIADEMAELRRYVEMARLVRNNTKGEYLLKGLVRAFAELDRLQAPRKAIIFTESRQTQNYLLSLLEHTPYGEGIVLFNGTNSDPRAQAIYRKWLARHEGSDRISGSKAADTRAALVEHFRDEGTVMIATEAGAEGINLQFCSLVINYDLPWNPQRIEQRIGRCHRYGQKHDVVVLNFVDLSNEADKRVFQLLDEKFQLFEGVFGASDEVLGAIGSGVDVERRIADIYATCRTNDTIRASFEQLQFDLSGEINEAMVRTRQMLLEHFDDEVHEKVRVKAANGAETRNRFQRMLMQLTAAELGEVATFEDDGTFVLRQAPAPELAVMALGRYELPRRSGEAHLYRVSHPLAQWVLNTASQRRLAPARLRFDYAAYGTPVSTLLPLRGRSGLLSVRLLTVTALNEQEQHLVVSGIADDGQPLLDDDAEKLLRLPAHELAPGLFAGDPHALQGDSESRKQCVLRAARERQLRFFEQEVLKLDAWADDLKLGLEQRIKDIDREVKEVRRSATISPTLEEKLHWQKRQRELEGKRSQLRRELFSQQDNIEAQRNAVIEQLEQQLTQQVTEQVLFTIEWELV